MANVNGTLLYTMKSDKDRSHVVRLWPVLKSVKLIPGDEIWSTEPAVQGLVPGFMVTRPAGVGEQKTVVFQCTLEEANKQTSKKQ